MPSFSGLKSRVTKIDAKLAEVFLPQALRHPRYLASYFRFLETHLAAKTLRAEREKEGVRIPPFLVLSITGRCNLSCSGCYASVSGIRNHGSLKQEQWRKVIEEACDLGVFGFVIAGGEPFLFPGLLEMCAKYKDRLFLIFTNGTMLAEEDYLLLGKTSNHLLLISLEGGKQVTDFRRGDGTYEKIIGTLDRLRKVGALYGVSATITRNNFHHWMDEAVVDVLISAGVKIGVFIEYIPTTPESSDMVLSPKERSAFRLKILEYRKKKRLYIIHSPGDEEHFGGCISAGRGFAHVTPSGDLTPCPVSNLTTHNLTQSSLREGLSSSFFAAIRDHSQVLETGEGPCALFSHPKEVEELASRTGAYRAT